MPANKVPVLPRKKIEQIIKFSVENSGKIKLPIMLWGYHGIGKTQIVKDVAEELNYNLVILHLSTQDIIDLIGRPVSVVKKNPVTNEDVNVQEWCVPNWLHDALEQTKETGKPNIFFLDEFNRGPNIVLSAMLPFLIEGVMHTHKINENDAIIAACNPDSDDYEVNELSDKAQLDRLGHVVLKPTISEYLKYLKDSGMDQVTIDVISANHHLVEIPKIDPDIELKASMRSVDYVMRKIKDKDLNWIKKIGHDIIKCYLGIEFADQWVAHKSKYNDLITMEMLFDYDKNEQKILKAITSEIDGIEKANVSVLEKINNNIISYFEENGEIPKKDCEWLTKFLSNPIIPGDELVKFLNKEVVFKSILNPEINKNLIPLVENLEINNHIETW